MTILDFSRTSKSDSKNDPLLTESDLKTLIKCTKHLTTPKETRLARFVFYLFLSIIFILIFNLLYFIIFDLLLFNYGFEFTIRKYDDSYDSVDLKYSPDQSLVEKTSKENDVCASIPNSERFDCFPQGTAEESTCTARGCCWKPISQESVYDSSVPWCFYPTGFQSYVKINETNGNHMKTIYLKNKLKSPYPNDSMVLKIVMRSETKNRIHVKIIDPTKENFESPFPEIPVMAGHQIVSNPNYDFVMDDGPGFKITRKSDGEAVFNSAGVGGFIFSSQMIQISSELPSPFMYGLGEHRNNFLLDMNWKRITLFNHDTEPKDNVNGYGTHPFYLNVDKNGKSSGVFLKNSHPMEIILQPAPAITYRVLGGILDFYIFLGPTPKDVVAQYIDLVGYPFMPPYWSLGFHMCKYGQKSLSVTKDTLARNKEAGIPIDVQWNDIDYMDKHNDFTYDKTRFDGLPEFVKNLHEKGMHYVVIMDPGVSGSEPKGTYPPYDEGIKNNLFLKNESGLPLIGHVWNSAETVFPDFLNPNTTDYWADQLWGLHEAIPFDGLWIDMNEPSNFYDGSKYGCPNNNLENPPYVPPVEKGNLNYHTVCMSTKQYLGRHYQLHNVYGMSEAVLSDLALKQIRNKRPFIISRSTFAGQGAYSGHWTGDIFSSWDDMKHSIGDIMSFNLFGIPMVGADICGFNGNTTAALCQRWLQLGAFYPFSRTHSSDDTIDQDPAALGKEVVESTRNVLLYRYALLPYLYSLFWRAHVYGETVARPLFFEFPNDERTYGISTQFMWGSGMMIVPVLKEGVTYVDAYLPGPFWYNLINGLKIVGGDVALSAPLDIIPLLIKPGVIIPGQSPSSTTAASRLNQFGIIVALDSDGVADGFLYWDDGDSLNTYESNLFNLITFSAANQTVSSKVEHFGFDGVNGMHLGTVQIYGIDSEVKSVIVNGTKVYFIQERNNKVLFVNFQWNLKYPLLLSWSTTEI